MSIIEPWPHGNCMPWRECFVSMTVKIPQTENRVVSIKPFLPPHIEPVEKPRIRVKAGRQVVA